MKPRSAELSLLILAGIIALAAFALVSFAREAAVPPGIAAHAALFAAGIAVVHVAVRRFAPRADPLLLPIAMLLAAFGYVMIRRLDPALGGPQLAWIGTGIAAFTATLALVRDHRSLERFRYSLMLLGIALLLLPLAPSIGRSVGGARLWVRVGTLNFQPAELAKVILATFLAGYLAQKREVMTIASMRIGPLELPAPRHFGPLILAWGLSLALIVWERDLGSSVLFFALFVVTLYVATARASYAGTGLALFAGGVWFTYHAFGHVQTRIAAWLDPWSRIEGAGFQIGQSVWALATGGISGTGLGRGHPGLIQPGRGATIPTDFIFSAIGEELGLLGTTAIALLFGLLVARGLRIALRSRDAFGTLLATGLTTIVGIQALLIMAGVSRLVPLTGITLPFVAYGGSSLLTNFVLVGLLIRMSDAEAVD
ncbi:MAG: FtsW/RodA/SpoVE family cell cycle protein [Acidobacteria bacterium]|nr:FtsW/RodA/SpoVE family cell cycle protein [Acidobacteriota bacterium]